MTITLDVPPETAERLQPRQKEYERAALEAYVVAAYESGALSRGQVGQILNLGSFTKTVEFLSSRGLYPNYTVEDFDQDVRNLADLHAARLEP